MCLALPMRVVELLPPDKARAEAGGVSLEVSLMLVGDVAIGDYVIVHAGFALEVLDTEAAEETLGMISQMAEEDISNNERT